jgi:hypothetical protein
MKAQAKRRQPADADWSEKKVKRMKVLTAS